MAHIKKLLKKRNEGKITFGDGIVDNIVLLAMSEVPYAELYHKSPSNKKPYKAINVVFDKDGVNIDVYVKVHYSQCVSDMAFKIQETIRHNVENMTDYHIASVNVIVKGLTLDETTVVAKEVVEQPAKTEEKVLKDENKKTIKKQPKKNVTPKKKPTKNVKENK